MKNSRLLLLIVIFLWNCSAPEFGIESEMLPDTELYLLPEDVTVQDLLQDNSPEEFKHATGRILTNTLGRKLLQRVKDIPNRFLIFFRGIEDKDGNLDMSSDAELRYYGTGRIDYNYKALRDPNNDELMFHEFFHFYQHGNMLPVRNRNNEVEAYVAQYLYATSKSSSRAPKIIDNIFTSILAQLVKAIDKSTGNFLAGADLDKFYKNYQAALDYLELLPAYSDEGWFSLKIDRNTHPFPNIVKLMKS